MLDLLIKSLCYFTESRVQGKEGIANSCITKHSNIAQQELWVNLWKIPTRFHSNVNPDSEAHSNQDVDA